VPVAAWSSRAERHVANGVAYLAASEIADLLPPSTRFATDTTVPGNTP